MNIKSSLSQFGLTEKEIDVYLLLFKQNWITALELSRISHIKRPTLYRILETLRDKGLVEVKLEQKTTLFNASSVEQLQNIIINKESQITKMKLSYTLLENQLKTISQTKPQKTNVHFYRGLKSLQYLEVKKTKYKNENLLIFGSPGLWHKFLGYDFAEDVRQKYVDNNIKIFELINPPYVKPISNVLQVSWTKNINYLKHHYSHRQVEKKILDLVQDIYIIKNSIFLHSYTQDEQVGIEIVNKNYALMLKQLFYLTWNQAKKIDKFCGKDLP